MSDDVISSTGATRLRTIVERIERLEEDKAAVSGDIKEVYAEAKGEGYDVKILRRVVRLRKLDKAKRQEEEALLALYMNAVQGDLFGGAGGITAATVTLLRAMPTGERAEAVEALTEDALYAQAKAIVIAEGKHSTSHIQRRLQLGYNHAAALIERMEREGVIGPPDPSGKRELLAIGQHAAG